MRSRMIQGGLSLSGGLLVLVAMLWLGAKSPNPAAAYSPPDTSAAIPLASFHLWEINEIFSCPDGSVQFVEMRTTSTGQEFLQGHELQATNGAQTHSFIFPNNKPNYSTTPKFLLIATTGFSSLAGVTPDYTLPITGFIFTTGAGSVELVGAVTPPLTYSAGQLPLDGLNSLAQGGVITNASPTNFAGQTGSISCLPKLTLSKSAQATGIVEAGNVLTYTIVVANGGIMAATNALITDAVPLSATFVPNSASNSGVFGSGVISWANLTISQGTAVTRTFQITVGATITTGDRITNTAYISSAEGKVASGSVTITAGQEINKKTYLPIIRKNS